MMSFAFIILVAFTLGMTVLMFASYWVLFEKAGREGWEGIIPIYNIYVLLQIIGKPTTWLIYLLFPIINIYYSICILDLFVKSFGKDSAYTVLCLIFPFIFLPVLAFGDEVYLGPAGSEENREEFV